MTTAPDSPLARGPGAGSFVTTTEDPLHDLSSPDLHWTTANMGEAIPGVQTPLSWTLMAPAVEYSSRSSFVGVGAFTKQELPWPPPLHNRTIRGFHGRACACMDLLGALGDRLPGTTGEQVVRGLLGNVPATMQFAPSKRRFAHVAVGLTRNHVQIPGKLAHVTAETRTWWKQEVARIPHLDDPAACAAAFDGAAERWHPTMALQGMALFSVVQPMYDMLTRIGEKVGVDDIAGLTGGYGGVPEAAVVAEMWEVSRGRMRVEQLVAELGFHGPLEGEISSHVWREDDTPLRRLAEQYASLPESENPLAQQAARRAEREHLERQFVAGAPRVARPLVRALLGHASSSIPLRGVAKGSFLQVFDVLRAAARRLGELHASQDTLDDPEDVFYLRADEVQAQLRPDVQEVVAQRRAWREEHLRVRIPTEWRGMPSPIKTDAAAASRDSLAGTGVSHGVAEGIARVVIDPAAAEVQHGDILVSAATDPSWASIMFLSSALVVDIGGHLSHAAVVARELGIPCVVNTIDGSRMLRSGDRIRVNGDKGTVEVLARAPSAAES